MKTTKTHQRRPGIGGLEKIGRTAGPAGNGLGWSMNSWGLVELLRDVERRWRLWLDDEQREKDLKVKGVVRVKGQGIPMSKNKNKTLRMGRIGEEIF